MSTSPSGMPYGPYDRQPPARITGVVRTRPGVWRIAWGVCLGLFLFSLICAAVGIAVALALGATVDSNGIELKSLSAGNAAAPTAMDHQGDKPHGWSELSPAGPRSCWSSR